MMKKLTPKELYDRKIQKILNRIKAIEKQYSIDDTRIACYRYYNKRSEEFRIQQEIKHKEAELVKLKKKVF